MKSGNVHQQMALSEEKGKRREGGKIWRAEMEGDGDERTPPAQYNDRFAYGIHFFITSSNINYHITNRTMDHQLLKVSPLRICAG